MQITDEMIEARARIAALEAQLDEKEAENARLRKELGETAHMRNWNFRHYEAEKSMRERAEAQLVKVNKALDEIEKEAKIANSVIALNRDGGGAGRVKVATAMHRIERVASRVREGGKVDG